MKRLWVRRLLDQDLLNQKDQLDLKDKKDRVSPNVRRLMQIGFWAAALAIPTIYWLRPALSSLTVASSIPEVEPIEPPAETRPTAPVESPAQIPTAQRSTKPQNAKSIHAPASLSCAPEQSHSLSHPHNVATPAANSLAPQPKPQELQSMIGFSLVGNLGAAVAAQSAGQFPQINGLARLARVPVMMYHDILPTKQVFFDVTPAEFEADLKLIQQQGLTPISLDQLMTHLSTGAALPEKPIVLSFDDGYEGHYKYVYPLLKKYGYPGTFAIYPSKVGKKMGRSSLNWTELREMAADPLITIASHSVSHPDDLTKLSDSQLRQELIESKRSLEAELGILIRDFVYPAGHYDKRVQTEIQSAGYRSAFTMNDAVDQFAGASADLLSIERIGQGNLETVIKQAYSGPPPKPIAVNPVEFDSPTQLSKITVNTVPLILASGGRPITIHANSRNQVADIVAKTNAYAAVDGAFFSLEYLDSNVMVGPVLSQSTGKFNKGQLIPGKFVPGAPNEIRRIKGRPLVLISSSQVKYVPFDPGKHNTLNGIQAELPQLTDAFVAAAWLVKDGQAQPKESFGNLFDFDAARDRAFWGIDQAGRSVVGVSGDYVDSVALGKALMQAGMRDAVMLDSGASASLVFRGKSQMSYEPRPVPHVVALVPVEGLSACTHPAP